MNWYYSVGGRQSGPVPEEELRRLHQTRAIDDQTFVWHEGAPSWQPIRTFPQLVRPAPDRGAQRPARGSAGAMTIEQLRDRRERTALVWLTLFAIPAWLYVLAVIVFTFGMALPVIALVFAIYWLMQLFAAAHIKTNTIRVSERQLPEVFAVARACCQRLGMEMPDIHVMQHSVWNAMASKLAGHRYVVLYSGALDSILLKGDMSQVAWLVGHELGHHFAGHLDFVTRCRLLGGWFPWLLLWYNRRRELTCDRVGLYCAGSLQASQRALANATAGAQLGGQVNIAAAIQQWEGHHSEFFVLYRVFYSSYPPLLWRLQALQQAAAEFDVAV